MAVPSDVRRIPIDGPIDLPLTLGLVKNAAQDRTERRGRAMWWATHTPDGATGVHLRCEDGGVRAEAWGPGRAWALDQAPAVVGAHDSPERFEPTDEVVRRLHRASRGLRIGATARVVEAAMPMVLGQKITVVEAERARRGVVRRFGSEAPGPCPVRIPPAAEVLARVAYTEYHQFGVERRRADLLRAVGRRAARLEETVTMDRAAAHRRLTALPGIGPWTAGWVRMIALGDPDAVPVGDYHIPNTVAFVLAGEPRADDARMLELLDPYEGQRGRVVRLLKDGGVAAPKYGPKTAIHAIDDL